MKNFCIFVLAIMLFATACGQDRPDTASPDLESLLSMVPAELSSDSILFFSNLERMRDLIGKEHIQTSIFDTIRAATEDEEIERRINIFEGYADSAFSGGRKHMRTLKDSIGYGAFDLDREIWAARPVQESNLMPLFSVMKGDFDPEAIGTRLELFGSRESYGTFDYYAVAPDIQKEPLSLFFFGQVSRIKVTGQEIVAAADDRFFFPVLDTGAGERASLGNNRAYTAIARELAGVLGAALIPQALLLSNQVHPGWGRLHPYELAGIGYEYGEQSRKAIIVLYYPDGSAANDLDEIKRRLAEYQTLTSHNGPLLTELFHISEPQAVMLEPGSILRVELEYREPVDRGRLGWWFRLVEDMDLGFLVVDPVK